MTRIYQRTCLVSFAAVAFVAFSAGSAGAQVERTTPRPEVVKLAQDVIGAVNGDADAVDKFVKEHFTPEYRAAKPTEDRRKWFDSVRAKYGKLKLSNLQRSEEDNFTIIATSEKNGEVRFSVTHDENLKVRELALADAGGQ